MVEKIKEVKMKRKGFTLLELMIVVIIIGILATLALPQFFKVAERARSSEGTNILGALRSAEIRYYMEHAVFTDDMDDLDINVTAGSLKHFEMPTLNDAGDLDSTGDLATIQRTGGYTLHISPQGNITCTDTGAIKCPTGFEEK